MSRTERTVHPEFVKYQQLIVSHENYKDMPEAISPAGEIKWVTTGSSALGRRRKEWWLKRKAHLTQKGIEIASHAELSPVALANHPTKKKCCQTCGKYLSLEYVYPTKNCLKKINRLFDMSFDEAECSDIYEIITIIYDLGGMESIKKLDPVFEGVSSSQTLEDAESFIKEKFVRTFSSKLSPGAMSNCPDRLDGYHSYNRCCRATQDTGRHASNLIRYGEDRRAYENWADGDWKAASWLMRLFAKNGISADHIGPISLGFAHRPVFQPLTRSQNSSKGNRMTLADFHRLITDERKNPDEIIISWHSRPIWDRLKVHVKSQSDVYELCKFMRQNIHNIFTILAALKQAGMTGFLDSLLHPEYAYYSIEFTGFNPTTGEYSSIIKTKGNITQYSRNAARYMRIASGQLDLYMGKENRKSKNLEESYLCRIVATIQKFADSDHAQAKEVLIDAIDSLAQEAEQQFLSGKKLRDELLDD